MLSSQDHGCCNQSSKKIIDLPGGQINDPLSRNYFSLQFLPSTPSSLMRCFRNCRGARTLSRTTDLNHDYCLLFCCFKTREGQGPPCHPPPPEHRDSLTATSPHPTVAPVVVGGREGKVTRQRRSRRWIKQPTQ